MSNELTGPVFNVIPYDAVVAVAKSVDLWLESADIALGESIGRKTASNAHLSQSYNSFHPSISVAALFSYDENPF